MNAGGRIGLLVNPTAGRGAGAAAGRAVLAGLRDLGHQVSDLSGPDLAASSAAVRARAAALDALVVVGGDGLVHTAVQAVAGTATALAIVPAGTGNDIARGLDLPVGGITASMATISAALRDGRTRAVDLVRVGRGGGDSDGDGDGATTAWFVSILASGVDALINQRANGWRWPRGPARYTLAALRELAVVRGIGLRITLDGVQIERDALLVAVANTRSYGGGILIAPDADPTDGLLDVVVVERLSAFAALRIFPQARRGAHLGIAQVKVHRARIVTLDALPGQQRPHPYADGEPFGDLPVTCEVVPGALRVLA
ncbi:MAG: diacylglycerol/lipid kinase family protein [Janthinobacterium lividum]